MGIRKTLKFYGVYAKNMVGVYDDWTKVVVDKTCFYGFKVKKFSTLEAAVEFIEMGLGFDYHVVPFWRLNEDALLDMPFNTPILIREIITL